jgi:hypothetical protein
MEIEFSICWCDNKESYYVCTESCLPKIILCNKCGTIASGDSINEVINKWNRLISEITERANNISQEDKTTNFHTEDPYNISRVNLS